MAGWDSQTIRPKVCIATLLDSRRTVSINWARILREFQWPTDTDHYLVAGLPWGPARNNCVKYMLSKDFTHLLFWDSDVIPPADGLIKLLKQPADIISGLYYTRYAPIQPVAYYERIDAAGNMVKLQLQPFNPGDILKVDFVGMGFCLITRKALELVPIPWFIWEMDVTTPTGASEDFHFCHKARAHGFSIYLHTGVQCQHETRAVSSVSGLGTEIL